MGDYTETLADYTHTLYQQEVARAVFELVVAKELVDS